MGNLLVHMVDGTTQTLTSDELAALDPTTWVSQEPADRPVYIINPVIVGTSVNYEVVHRFTGAMQGPFGDLETATTTAETLNAALAAGAGA